MTPLDDLIAAVEAGCSEALENMADDAADAEHTGERPDLFEYFIVLTIPDAERILAVLRAIKTQEAGQ